MYRTYLSRVRGPKNVRSKKSDKEEYVFTCTGFVAGSSVLHDFEPATCENAYNLIYIVYDMVYDMDIIKLPRSTIRFICHGATLFFFGLVRAFSETGSGTFCTPLLK